MCVHNSIAGNDCLQCLGSKGIATIGTSAIIGGQASLIRSMTGENFFVGIPSIARNFTAFRSAPKPVLLGGLILTGATMLATNATGFTDSLKSKLPGEF